MGILSGLISMFGWGTSDFLAANSSRKIGYLLTYFWTQLVAFSLTLIYFLIKFPRLDINNIPQFLIFLAPAGFLFMIGTLAFYKGFIGGQVSLVSPIGASWAMITVVLSVIFFKEILQTNQIIAVVLIILGIILVSTNLKEVLKIKRFTLLKGVKEGLIAMLAWGISLFLIVPASKALGWFLPVFVLKFFGLLLLVIYTLFSRKSLKINFQSSFLILLFFIGFLDVIAFFGYSFGVEGEYASIIAPIAAAFPLITIILARILLKERFVLNQIFGIISVIIGLVLISI